MRSSRRDKAVGRPGCRFGRQSAESENRNAGYQEAESPSPVRRSVAAPTHNLAEAGNTSQRAIVPNQVKCEMLDMKKTC